MANHPTLATQIIMADAKSSVSAMRKGEPERPWQSLLPEEAPWRSEETATDTTQETKPADEVRFLRGPVRWAIDNGPGIVLATTIGLVTVAEVTSPGVEGIGTLVPGLGAMVPGSTVSGPVLLAVVACWAVLLVGILLDSGVVSLRRLLRTGAVVTVTCGLVLGTVVSVFLVTTSDDPRALAPNVVYASGYLLMLLLLSWYIRESMEYTETLLTNLRTKVYHPATGSTTPQPEEAPDAARDADHPYAGFVRALNEDLRTRLAGRVRSAHAFGVVLVAPFAVVWWLGTGPQNLGAPSSSPAAFLTYSVNLVVDFVIAVVAFQFLVLVRYLHDLTTGSYSVGDDGYLVLEYDLQHPDECAGLSGLGTFAMKVNLLMIGAMVYLLYRVHTQGLRVLPPGTVLGQGTVVPFNWLLSYVGPIFIFTVIASVWLYYSMWGLHKKMAEDRRRILETWPDRAADETVHISLDDPDWRDARDAPVWPIDNRRLLPLVFANLAPAVVVLIEGAQLV